MKTLALAKATTASASPGTAGRLSSVKTLLAAVVLLAPVLAWAQTAAPTSDVAASAAAGAGQEARSFIAFVQEFASACVQRNGVQIQVRSTHPQRTVRVWMDRFHMGVGTGDRSRSDLKPGADPEPLGCSRTLSGTQEWRIVRAQFVD